MSDNYLSNLNEKQYEAATTVEGPLLILAGAGSGKTSTMTRRIAYMIRECGISPWEILAVTFTNKAAKEMRERAESLVGNDLNMWITTFHSACLRILRMHADVIGYGRDFTIYDPADQKAVMKSLYKSLDIDDKQFKAQSVLAAISDAKEKGKTADIFSHEASGYREQVIGRLYRGYENTLQKNNAMDFDDLIWRTVELFDTSEELLERYRNKFKYVMVDEYQDTNYMQYRLVKMLAEKHRNICVVGDDDQCIYQWRGADIRNILSFEEDFAGARVIKLEQNYRSTGNILKAAHSVIRRNKGRKDKQLWTKMEDGCGLRYRRLDSEKAEAQFAASEIFRLHREGRAYNDFAVLYRTNAQSRAFEEAFMQGAVPYRVLGGTKFYDRKEIKDIMAYMRLVANPADDVALTRIINEPKRSIGDKTLEKLRLIAAERDASLFEVLADEDIVGSLSAKAAKGVTDLVMLLAQCHAQQDEMNVSDIYDRLVSDSGYMKMLEDANTVEAEARLENLLEFKSAIYDAEDDNPEITLSEFLEQVALVADIDNHRPDEDAVVLMTLHSAKGLEFPVVFMVGMEDGLFPGQRSMDTEEGREEERRLCYVGITRAKESLYLTSAITRTLYGRTEYTRESMFMREIDSDLFDEESDQLGIGSYRSRSQLFAEEETTEYNRNRRPFDAPLRGGAGPQEDRLRSQARSIAQRSSEIRKAAGAAQGTIAAKDRVSHTKFGEGLVISVNGNIASIMFDKVGMKKLALDMAPLTKI